MCDGPAPIDGRRGVGGLTARHRTPAAAAAGRRAHAVRPPAQNGNSPSEVPPRHAACAVSSQGEHRVVLDRLHSRPFVVSAPAAVNATLLDEGACLCSPRTMYGILQDQDGVRERRNQARHPHCARFGLPATRPGQVAYRGVTGLMGPATRTYNHLHVILDVFI